MEILMSFLINFMGRSFHIIIFLTLMLLKPY